MLLVWVMDLTARVARRFTAEVLTKQWLMAVRRGWLSLMKPQIQDWDDVFRALGKLHTFASNLQAQVLNVRRGPYSSPATMSTGEELRKAFKDLLFQVEDAGSSALHWRQCAEGKTPFNCRPDGEKMLALYQSDFNGATARSKELRGGRARSAPLTEFLDDVLEILYKDAKRIRDHEEKHPGEDLDVTRDVFKEFQLGGAKIVVLDEKTNGRAIETYIDLLDKAYQDLKRKGFGKVWYGAILITHGDYEKLGDAEKAAYARAGYKNLESRAGTYHSGEDIVKITAPPEAYFQTTVIHEMGHRYWFKFMTPAKRAKFEMLVEGTYTKAHAVMLNQDRLTDDARDDMQTIWRKLESGQEPSVLEKDFLEELYKNLGIRAGIPLVSQYATSDIREAFAEVFERYVSESNLSRPQVESLRSVLAFDQGLDWKDLGLIKHL